MGIKYSVNENFFEKWSPQMAYILGYIYADGSLTNDPYMRGKYISITSIDKESIINIKKILNSEHIIKETSPSSKNAHVAYHLRIGSHVIYNSLIKYGLHPNKSLNAIFPDIPKKFLNSFVRGYFDGDGCVYLEQAKGKTQKIILKRLGVVFTSGSKSFLEGLKLSLEKHVGVNKKSFYNSHRSFQLRYQTSDSVKLFNFFYKNILDNCYTKRKVDIFLKYFNLRPERIDKNVIRISKKLSDYGHVVKW